jgi:protoporphyrinogen oxidase
MKIGIIGAGPCGLCLGLFLQHDTDVVEAETRPGGTAGSFTTEGYTFDNGPHIMFSKRDEILAFMVGSLGDNVHRCRRKNRIAHSGTLVKYPFENDLAALPLQTAYECVRDYFINPWRDRHPSPSNLREWFLHTFGEAMCEAYFFPYNEKVWNVPVDRLSMLWADRIPQPPPADVLKSAMGISTEGYVHQLFYHYPLRGGYRALSEAWAQQVAPRYGFEVDRIDRCGDGRLVIASGGDERTYDRLVSTIPLERLAQLCAFEVPDRVREAIAALTVNPLVIVSLGIRGVDEEQMTAVYFPDADYKVNRISFPATFSPFNAPEGHYSIQAEITCRRDDLAWSWDDQAAVTHVAEGLVTSGVLGRDAEIAFSHVHRLEYAYVVYEQGYEDHARVVREWFPAQGIDLCGRFGYFEYVNVDGVVARALELASALNGEPVDLGKVAV